MKRIQLSEIKWGSLDADKDRDLLNKFVEPWPINLLFDNTYSLISGTKGSGKSAIRHVLLNKYADEFVAIADISFNNIEFLTLIEGLENIASLTSIDNVRLLTNYWLFSLIFQSIDAYLSKQYRPLTRKQRKLEIYFEENIGREGTKIFDKLLIILSKVWTFLDDETKPDNESISNIKNHESVFRNKFSSNFLSKLRDYPLGELTKIKILLHELVSITGKKILLIIDGFDRISNSIALRPKINIVFESFVSAVSDICQDQIMSDIIQIKAMIPHDRYINIKVRDKDKLKEFHASILWNYNSLRDFLAKRIALNPQFVVSDNTDFEKLWAKIMPEDLENVLYKVRENSYDYILRHTMYRPRQLLLHLNSIARKNHNNNYVDEKMIREAIRESSREMADFFFLEYEIEHPYLKEFVSSQFKMNIMSYSEFKDIISKNLSFFKIKSAWDEEINILYNIGFFGIIREISEEFRVTYEEYRYIPPTHNKGNRYYIEFAYKDPNENACVNIANRLHDSTKIALHPIFVDFSSTIEADQNLIVG